MPDRLPLRATVLLGIVTIAAFGTWLYGYGVLLEPIRLDTGWSEALLSTIYGGSLLGSGVLATLAGRLLHRHGSRWVYGISAGAVLVAYLATAQATGELGFALASLVAGSLTGGLGYYALVHTVIAQLVAPAGRARAITTNTLWGAFASPVFLPLMAWLVLTAEWRATLRIVGSVVAASFALVAVTVPDRRDDGATQPSLRAALSGAARDRVVRALLFTTFAGGLVTSLLVLYQVPVMVAGGLSLGLASGLAGARGFLQLLGRIPMPWLVRRFGSRTTLRLSHVLVAISCLLLPLARTLSPAMLFAVVAGIALGALVPVESIFSADALRSSELGMVLGLSSLTRGVGSAIGPALAGLLTTTVGTRTWSLVAGAAVALVAAVVVPLADRAPDSA